MTATLRMDQEARKHGRYLYRVYEGDAYVGSVARWDGQREWTMNASWLPSIGYNETPAEAGRTRRTRADAVADLLEAARDAHAPESQCGRCPACRMGYAAIFCERGPA